MPCPAVSSPPENLAFRPRLRLKQRMEQKILHRRDDTGFDAGALLAAVGKSGDRAAFVALFSHYAPRVKSYLLKNGADNAAAEEIVQNTFVAVWEKAKTYDPAKAAASTWIFTIARNKRIDALRREKFIEVNSDSPALERAADTAEAPYADEGAVALLNAALEALPEEQARLLRMSFFEDKSHGAIARETDIPLGTVKSRLRLGLDRLRHLLKGNEE